MGFKHPARLFPKLPATKKPSDDKLLDQLNNKLRRVSSGTFWVRPLLSEPREKLHRGEIAVGIPDCGACRLCLYLTAAKVDGVEQTSFDTETSRLIVWMNSNKSDLAPVRDALAKARVQFPAK